MEEIKVNDYVRTKKGQICKVLGIREEQRVGKRVYSHLAYYLDNHKGSLTPAFIVKHSPNIIDLIEVGDYVNGKLITDIDSYEIDNKEIKYLVYDKRSIKCGNYLAGAFYKENIKDVVTKEQFNQVKYEV